MEALPQELIEFLLPFLPLSSLNHCLQLNKKWHLLVTHLHSVWRRVYQMPYTQPVHQTAALFWQSAEEKEEESASTYIKKSKTRAIEEDERHTKWLQADEG